MSDPKNFPDWFRPGLRPLMVLSEPKKTEKRYVEVIRTRIYDGDSLPEKIDPEHILIFEKNWIEDDDYEFFISEGYYEEVENKNYTKELNRYNKELEEFKRHSQEYPKLLKKWKEGEAAKEIEEKRKIFNKLKKELGER